ncbi:MAG: peptidoglycan editing factor PgeF [Lachnospiraceae bacterium]|nr:peptidoglycan editing factor PgeF [Lachnospiraceae bacterium]
MQIKENDIIRCVYTQQETEKLGLTGVAQGLTYHTDPGKVPYLSFPGLEALPGIGHLYTTRLGGVSEGIFGDMNFSILRGDTPEHVHENYGRVAATLHIEPSHLVASYQTHTKVVRDVDEASWGMGVTRDRDYVDVDGLITATPDTGLVIFYADCVPILFADPVKRVIAACHAGWRGTAMGIPGEVLHKMTQEYGCNIQNIHAGIGPSISGREYEVGQDVIDAFAMDYPGDVEALKEMGVIHAKGNGKFLLDLWGANARLLLNAGILPEHLEITDICTFENPELLFSHRASNGKRGVLCAFLTLQE